MSDEVDTVEGEVLNEITPPSPEPVKPPAAPPKATAKPVKPASVATEPTTADGAGNESQPAEVVAIYISEGQHQLARRIAADAYESSTTRAEFVKAFVADPRLDGTTDDEGKALLVAGEECAAYWLTNAIAKPTAHIPG